MLKKHKNKIIIISLIAIGVLLVIFSTFKGKNTDNTNTDEFSCKLYTKELEEKIEKFLLNVDGIKNVNVIITLDSSAEKIYGDKNVSYDLLSINSSKKGITYTQEIYPCVRGVAIACTNGDSDEVKNKITRLISAYLGIPTNRIEIVNFG